MFLKNPMTDLCNESCTPLAKGSSPLEHNEIVDLRQQVPEWSLEQDNRAIARTFSFANYYETISFANAVAWIAHQQDHHPEMTITYNRCRIEYSTHSVGGLSRNDFICACKIDSLLS
jgi:4a-hydroxytetrahydrobiopterin dehydratase